MNTVLYIKHIHVDFVNQVENLTLYFFEASLAIINEQAH